MDQNIIKLQKLYESFGEVKFDTWLDGLNYSQAFLVTIAAGPWKYARRLKIQTDALKCIKQFDLSQFNPERFFPLDWQNNITAKLIKVLQKYNWTMEEHCRRITRVYDLANYQMMDAEDRVYPQFSKSKLITTLSGQDSARKQFYWTCGSPNGTKVLSLFCRDKLKIDSFPIDRHCKRILQAHSLPTKEEQMIELCRAANLDPRKVATGIIKSANVQNPDWSKVIGDYND